MDAVKVVPYNTSWPAWYNEEAQIIKSLFATSRLIAIEHYGSTAVPGLAAKPTIGILVGIESLPLLIAEQSQLTAAGYTMYKQLEGRSYWRKNSHHSFTVAITTFGSETWFDHLVIRDYLRRHSEAAQSYAAIKYDAIKQGQITPESYRQHKNEFLEKLFVNAKQWQKKH